MKKAIHLLAVSLVVMMCAFFPSCTSEKAPDLKVKLETIVSDNTSVVMSGDIHRLFEQLDIVVEKGHIVLPDYLKTALCNDEDDDEDSLDCAKVLKTLDGVDYTDAVLAFNIEPNEGLEGMLVFGLTDEKDFVSSLKKIDDSLDQGTALDYLTIGDGGQQLLIKDNLAYFVFNDYGVLMPDESARIVERWNRMADATPLDDWKKEYLCQHRVVNCLISVNTLMANTDSMLSSSQLNRLKSVTPDGFRNGFIALGADLDGSAMKFYLKVFDNKGAILESQMNGQFNTAMMDFAYPEDIIAAGWCMNQKGYDFLKNSLKDPNLQPNLNGYYEYRFFLTQLYEFMRDNAGVPAEYLSEGGIFAAGGLDANFSPLKYDSPSSYHVVFAADLKPAKARAAYAEVTRSVSAMFDDAPGAGMTEVTVDGIAQKTIAVRYTTAYSAASGYNTDFFEVYIALVDNVLVVSNKPVKRNQAIPFSKELFDGKMAAFQMTMTPESPLMKIAGMDMGINLTAQSTGSTGELVFEFTHTDTKVIPEIFKLASYSIL
ncbi:MAG: hypothetical protein J1F20_01795 [Muribaculaceae bacterium]|nr:hypothetical protein [Muribaculaceae bacterium]